MNEWIAHKTIEKCDQRHLPVVMMTKSIDDIELSGHHLVTPKMGDNKGCDRDYRIQHAQEHSQYHSTAAPTPAPAGTSLLPLSLLLVPLLVSLMSVTVTLFFLSLSNFFSAFLFCCWCGYSYRCCCCTAIDSNFYRHFLQKKVHHHTCHHHHLQHY